MLLKPLTNQKKLKKLKLSGDGAEHFCQAPSPESFSFFSFFWFVNGLSNICFGVLSIFYFFLVS